MLRFWSLLSIYLVTLTKVISVPIPQGVIYAVAPAQRGAFHVGKNGVYNYGYNTGDGIAKVEVRHSDGSVTGSYRYFDPLGRQIVRSYIADDKGFRVLGNDLPSAPDAPAIGILDAQTLTGAVEGTNKFSPPTIRVNDQTPLLFTGRDNILRFNTPVNFRRQSIRQPRFRTRLDTRNGYFLSQTGLDTPYFYSSDKIDYDFPAGFAYNSIPVVRARPIGVQGISEKLPITTGHSNGRSNKIRTIESAPTLRTSHFPFIVGHAK